MAGHSCVGYVEIDKFARKSYEAIHDTEGEWTAHDITSVSDDDLRLLAGRGIDVICGGFPCQAFSIAGKRGGFSDTRGTLFFEIARFASIIKPKYLFLENVKGLLNHAGGETFRVILNTLDELGYDAEWQVLNSKDFGVPQNRERVFIIGHLRGASTREVFPIIRADGEAVVQNEKKLKELTKGVSDAHRVYDANGLARTLKSEGGGLGAKTGLYMVDESKAVVIQKTHGCSVTVKEDETGTLQATRLDKVPCLVVNGELKLRDDNMSTCLPASYYKGLDNHGARTGILQRGRGFNEGGLHEIAPTLTKNSYEQNNHLLKGAKIRKLTPRECWRLQGFPDWAFDKAQQVNSDSQLYKQSGNSVTINVVYEVAERL
ncbi:DNA (cytosine-5)-methyltransferase 1 [Aneurinibacillus soli]|uniref:Cytosine-specific methyltransferase n=3 Tax=Aneurinibacillus soli TaxID=1500254 RepID=A0A0U5C7M8_9BACL|nr:DNA (cytosine-5)-methyltransferase 1 [Aneurinibacillus soli]BAU28243.1 Modification methylase HhaI [Aneurinibacillus soli]